ncbi:MAG: ATP-binding protein [Bryobacterales bacterium]|nr:ATP-binding protein [Bryobacterales bacterium]
MTTRIFFKLILTLVGLLAVTAIGMQYLVTLVTERSYMDELRRSLETQARISELSLRVARTGTLERTIDQIAEKSGVRVTLIRTDGSVIADSEADPAAMENHAKRPEFVVALKGGTGSNIRLSRTVGREFLYVAIPTTGGALRLALPTPEIDAHTQEIRSNVLSAAVLAVIPIILLAGWLARRVSAQVSEIIRFARDLAQGKFEGKRPSLSGGELGQLSRTLESAAQQLRSTFEQVQQERSRFEAAVNGIGEGVLVVGRDKLTVLANPAMQNMFPSEPCSNGQQLDAWSRDEIRFLFEDVFQHGEWRSVDLTTNEPVHRAWKVSCAPITDPSGGVQAAVAVFYDITELEMVDRMRRDFVINVSHELRTPLTAIQGYTETLLDGAIDEAENNRRFLRIIRQNSERLAQLTADLMALSQIEVKAREFSFLPHKVNELLIQAADALQTETKKKQIRITVEPVEEGLQVDCDSEAIRQVLLNLMDNATKYTSQGGSINLGAFLVGDDVCFFVRDTGIGIPQEHIPRLFERFYRVDKARSRALGGTGLGLAIVKHLVLAHDGQVRVESEVGKGSTFYFQLPASAAREPAVLGQAVLF